MKTWQIGVLIAGAALVYYFMRRQSTAATIQSVAAPPMGAPPSAPAPVPSTGPSSEARRGVGHF